MNVDAYSLSGPWGSALNSIVTMMGTGMAAGDGYLSEGPSSATGVERYARAVVDANSRSDLGIVYGLSSVATCVAVQGGIVGECPVANGGWLKIPTIQQFVGVAPSGWRKSTVLDVAQQPLERALDVGERERREMTNQLMNKAKREADRQLRVDPELVLDEKQFTEIYNAGTCPETIVKDPTVESLRNLAVYNGGAVAALAGEADIFRNLTQYTPNGSASLTFFLDLWDQSSISTSRVGAGMLKMSEAALFLGVLFQTDVFAEVTSGGGGVRGGGSDSFVSRGMFGRIWVVEAMDTGGFAEIAAAYPDDALHELDGVDGMTYPDGTITPLGAALLDYESNLTALVRKTNEYRMTKALAHAWKSHATKLGNGLQVPEIVQIPRTAIRLTGRAIRGYNRLQRMYNALEAALAEMDEDARTLWGPLVARYVQHVMREALVVTLSAGQDQITEETIEDCATRIVPWRWALTTKALARRQEERLEDLVMQAAKENPKAEDRTVTGRVRVVLAKIAKEDPQSRETGWLRSDVTRQFGSTLPRDQRSGIQRTVNEALDRLAADPNSGVRRISHGVNKISKKPIERFVIEDWAIANSML